MEAIQPFLQVNRIENHLFSPEYSNSIFSMPMPSLFNVLAMRLNTGSLRQALLTEPNCPNILQGYEVVIQLRHLYRYIYGAGESSFGFISSKSS